MKTDIYDHKNAAFRVMERAAKNHDLKQIAAMLCALTPAADAKPKLTFPLHRRTRFSIRLAKTYGIHLSALVTLVAACTRRVYKEGDRGKKASWHRPAHWFAQQLGLSRVHMLRLFATAKEEGLLDYKRTARGLLVWVTSRSIYAELNLKEDAQARKLGFYYPLTAKVLGLNGSMIYQLLKQPTEDNDGQLEHRKLLPQRVAACLPWMTQITARRELERLFHEGYLQRENCHRFSGQLGFVYYWSADRKRKTVVRPYLTGESSVPVDRQIEGDFVYKSTKVHKMIPLDRK